ncbi:MAG: hypothetical protein ACP5GI_07455 [Sulfolobales archaeon]
MSRRRYQEIRSYIELKGDLVELGIILLIPLVVFYVALSIYPFDNQETNFLISVNASNQNITVPNITESYPAYISSLISAPSYRGEYRGNATIEEVNVENIKNTKVLILRVVSGEKVIYVALINPEDINISLIKSLINKSIVFEGVLVKKGDKYIVLAKSIAVIEKRGKEPLVYCVYKKKYREICREYISKHEKENEED